MKVEDIKITREWETECPYDYGSERTADVSYRIGDGTITTIQEVSDWVGGCYTCGEGFALDYVGLEIELDNGGYATIDIYPYGGMGSIGFTDVVCWIDKAINEKLTVEQMVKEAKKDENLSECSIGFRKH